MDLSQITITAKKIEQMTISAISGAARKIVEQQAAKGSHEEVYVWFAHDGRVTFVGFCRPDDLPDEAGPFGLVITYWIKAPEGSEEEVLACQLHTWGAGWIRCERGIVLDNQFVPTAEQEMYLWNSGAGDYVSLRNFPLSIVQ